jgi:hypothetical protein
MSLDNGLKGVVVRILNRSSPPVVTLQHFLMTVRLKLDPLFVLLAAAREQFLLGVETYALPPSGQGILVRVVCMHTVCLLM